MQGREEGKETPAAAFSDPARDTSVFLQRMKEQDEDRRKLTTKLSAAPGKRLEFKVAPPSAVPLSTKVAPTSADLKKLFPKLEVLDEAVWKTHVDLDAFGMSVEDAPPLDANTISILKTLFASLPIEGDAGITLLTLPRGLTLNKLVKLAASPKQGNAAKFQHIDSDALKAFGDTPINKTYRVAITNNVLKGSRKLSVDKQHELVKKMGCEMPGILPAATLAILTYMSSRATSPTRLFSNGPLTYTRCAEKVGVHNLGVGGFAPAGLYIPRHRVDFDFEDCGVGGLRKL